MEFTLEKLESLRTHNTFGMSKNALRSLTSGKPLTKRLKGHSTRTIEDTLLFKLLKVYLGLLIEVLLIERTLRI